MRDADFMNVMKRLGEKRIAELWCLPVVDVFKFPWDDREGNDILVLMSTWVRFWKRSNKKEK